MRMSDDLTRCVILALLLGALESVFKFFHSFNASLAVRRLWPHASSRVFVEVKSTSAFVLNVFTVDAGVENGACCWVWMSEEAILAWAKIVLSLWRLCEAFRLINNFCQHQSNLRNSVRSPQSTLKG